jgi:hypothetical protein
MKAAIALVYLFAISMLILAAAPLATGGLEVRVPEDAGQNWHLAGNYFYNPVEVSIFNGGMLDIQGMVVGVQLRDANSTLITTAYSPATQLSPSQWSSLNINISVDTLSLTRDQLRDMVFNTSNMQMGLKVDAGMALGMMSLSLDRTGLDNFTKSPMIGSIHVENEIRLQNVTGGMQASIPFKMNAVQSLDGTFVHVECIMRNSSAAFASTSQDIELHPSVSTTLDFIMNPVHAQAFLGNREPVHLEMTISYGRAEMPLSFSIPYEAAVQGVGLDDLLATPPHFISPTVHWLTVAAYQGTTANVTCSIRNATALIGATSLDHLQTASNTVVFDCRVSDQDWQWFLRHGDDWTITLTFWIGPYAQTSTIAVHWTPPLA